VYDRKRFTVLGGGDAEAITERIEEGFQERLDLGAAIAHARDALAGPDRELSPDDLEVAALGRGNGRRTFRRIESDELASLAG